MISEMPTAEPRRSIRRVYGKLFQFLARRLPLLPYRLRVLLQKARGVQFVDWRSVFLGEDVFFDDIYPEAIQVGRNVRITAGARILTHYFDTEFVPTRKRPFRFYQGSVIIGDNVFIGLNVVIAQPIKIGDGAVIGANSVLICDIPPNAIAAGSPARVVGERRAMQQDAESEGDQ